MDRQIIEIALHIVEAELAEVITPEQAADATVALLAGTDAERENYDQLRA